ncbi:putative secreted protein (Por secretion system target) [Myroides indicus]|uniref:Putative secreted protein (Por secretion system target) n=2 Tax=Myroides indicus TaxID=1323422 RepID=A0A4R7ENR8_9FLAO|nr:putative secreted protein (Por secretion system target) [Myroides indicus]
MIFLKKNYFSHVKNITMYRKIYTVSLLIGFVVGGYSQNKEIRQKIAEAHTPSQNKELYGKINYSKDVIITIANEKGIPLEGTTIQGNPYKAIGVDSFGKLIYRTTFNSGSRITSHVNDVAPGGVLETNLDGSGVTLGIWDGDVALNTHQEFVEGGVSRVILKDTPSPVNFDYVDNRNHATHVSGTMGAAGKIAMAKGMAPNATIVSYDWDNDVQEMRDEAKDNGLLVSNHSYGMPATDNKGNQIVEDEYFGAYEWSAASFDEITNTNPYYQPVVAAGNDGWTYPNIKPNINKNGNELILGTATAKNSIVVAAVHQVNNYTGAGSIKLAQFSSPGPTNDFRIKPDISAKGVDVYSSRFVSNGANDKYVYNSGTSMAAPAVTGIIGLWQQWSMNNRGKVYRSATLRALMAHTADEAGEAPGPDHKFGWGLINAKSGVQILKANGVGENVIISEENLIEGSVYEKDFFVEESGVNIVITIAWNDPTGNVGWSNFDESYMLKNPVLVNDLDVRVIRDGEEYFPWKLNKNFNNLIALKEDNDVDNIEKIEIEGAEEGVYTVRVNHKGVLKGGNQDFSIIVSKSDFNNLSADDFEEESIRFSIWPNPVQNELNVSVPREIDLNEVGITLFDQNGKLVKEIKRLKDYDVQIKMSELASGVYVVKVRADGLEKTERIIKK